MQKIQKMKKIQMLINSKLYFKLIKIFKYDKQLELELLE